MNKNWIYLFCILIILVIIIIVRKKEENFDNNPQFYISITTMKKYKEALDKLIESLPEGFTNYIIIYQDEDDGDYYARKEDGHYEVYLKRNIYEYGAWEGLYILKQNGILKDDDYILMLHDTCKVGKDTIELTNKYKDNGSDIYWGSIDGKCNICSIKTSAIDNVRENFKDIIFMEKSEAIRIENDHSYEKSIKNIKSLTQKFHDKVAEFIGSKKVYNSGVERKAFYYDSFDIEKYLVTIEEQPSNVHPMTP
jgi:hypothetical protein